MATHSSILAWRVPWTKELIGYSTAAAAAKSFQSCPTLCNPIDGSPPGSPVPGILQIRALEWVLRTLMLSNYKPVIKDKIV